MGKKYERPVDLKVRIAKIAAKIAEVSKLVTSTPSTE